MFSELWDGGRHTAEGREELSQKRPEATRGIVSRSQFTTVGVKNHISTLRKHRSVKALK